MSDEERYARESDGILLHKISRLESEQKKQRERDDLYKRGQLVFDGLLVLLTFGLVFIGSCGLRTARSSADAANTSAEAATAGAKAATSAAQTAAAALQQSTTAFQLQQKPYVFITDLKLDQKELFPDRPSSVTVYYRNNGQTPALHVFTDPEQHCEVGPKADELFTGPQIEMRPDYPNYGGGVLPANAPPYYFPIACPPHQHSDSVLAYGSLRYVDVFNNIHRVEYCARIGSSGGIEWCVHNNGTVP